MVLKMFVEKVDFISCRDVIVLQCALHARAAL
jgi:hypothetical protein